MELLELTSYSMNGNSLVPLYIYMYVKDKQIDESICKEYVLNYRNKLLEKFSYKTELASLKHMKYSDLSGSFFEKVSTIIKSNIVAHTDVSDDNLINVFETAIQNSKLDRRKNPGVTMVQPIYVMNPITIQNYYSPPLVTLAQPYPINYINFPLMTFYTITNSNY